jgi:hypothetical protein
MKTARQPPFKPGRHEQRTPPRHQDPYRLDAKMADPVECPSCHATYYEGRWTWHRRPNRVPEVKCPACRRIEDHVPGAMVHLSGSWFEDHRAEVIDRIFTIESRERGEHPLQRVVSMQDDAHGVEVATTDPHLARSIAVALHDAFKGELEMDFSGGDMPRARWTR